MNGVSSKTLDVAARRVEDAGAAERLPEVARDVPGRGPFERLLQLVERVLLVLQIGVAEHRLQDEQPVQLAACRRTGCDSRTTVPSASRPCRSGFDSRNRAGSCGFGVGRLRPHSISRRSRSAAGGSRRPSSRREATTSVGGFGRELRAPLAAVRAFDVQPHAEAAALDVEDLVDDGRIRCQPLAADAPEQIPLAVRLQSKAQPISRGVGTVDLIGWHAAERQRRRISAQSTGRRGVRARTITSQLLSAEPCPHRSAEFASAGPSSAGTDSAHRKSCECELGTVPRATAPARL